MDGYFLFMLDDYRSIRLKWQHKRMKKVTFANAFFKDRL